MTDQYFKDKEEERIIGEEAFTKFDLPTDTAEHYLKFEQGTPKQWMTSKEIIRSEQSDRALEQLDHNISKNPIRD